MSRVYLLVFDVAAVVLPVQYVACLRRHTAAVNIELAVLVLLAIVAALLAHYAARRIREALAETGDADA